MGSLSDTPGRASDHLCVAGASPRARQAPQQARGRKAATADRAGGGAGLGGVCAGVARADATRCTHTFSAPPPALPPLLRPARCLCLPRAWRASPSGCRPRPKSRPAPARGWTQNPAVGRKDGASPGSPAVPAGRGCVLGPRNLTAQLRAQASHANPAPVSLSTSFSSSVNANKRAR